MNMAVSIVPSSTLSQPSTPPSDSPGGGREDRSAGKARAQTSLHPAVRHRAPIKGELAGQSREGFNGLVQRMIAMTLVFDSKLAFGSHQRVNGLPIT